MILDRDWLEKRVNKVFHTLYELSKPYTLETNVSAIEERVQPKRAWSIQNQIPYARFGVLSSKFLLGAGLEPSTNSSRELLLRNGRNNDYHPR